MATGINLKPKSKKEEKRKQNIKMLRLFVVPLLTFLFFIIMLFALVIPQLQSVLNNVEEISAKNNEISAKNEELSNLDALFQNSSVINSQLLEIEEVTSTGDTQIVAYRDRVTDLANNNGLTINSERLSEIVDANLPSTVESQSNFVTRLGLQEVSAFFEFSGSLTNLTSFLEDLDTLPDFVVIKELGFTLADDSDLDNFRDKEWALEIQLVKYQFRETDEELASVYQNIPPTVTIDESVLEYLNER